MFLNTRLLSPVILEGPTQAPRESYEWIEYWKEQERRCLHGYRVGDVAITGPHYWYLNFWKIRAKQAGMGRKMLAPPRFLDIDHDFFWRWDEAKRTQKDLLVLKRRQTGFSNKYAALGGHEFTFFPDSQTVVVAGMEKFAKNTFNMIKRGLNELKDTEFYKNKSPDTASFMRASYTVNLDGVRFEEGFMSTCQYMVSDGDPQALISLSPSFVIYEEVGKFKGFLQVKEYAEPAMMNEGEKTGTSLLVGTGGEVDESIQELSEAFYNPDRYNLLAVDRDYDDDLEFDSLATGSKKKTCLFVPGYLYHKIDENGNSLIKPSIEDIMAVRKSKEGNQKAWLTYVTQIPLSPEESLLTPTGNVFNIKKLRERLMHVRRNLPDAVQRGDLEWVTNAEGRKIGVDWKPNALDGKFRIVEHPQINPAVNEVYKNLYVGGTDSYDKDKTVSVHGSFGASIVFKRFLDASTTANMPVASLFERPETAKEFFEDTAKLMVYYGWCENLIEHSNLLIFEWYESNGFTRLLKEKPMVAYATSVSQGPNNKYGIDTGTKHAWIQMLQDYVETSCDNLLDTDLIEALIAYKKDPDYNCDRTIALSLCVVNNQDMYQVAVRKEAPQAFKMGRFVIVGGRLQKIYT